MHHSKPIGFFLAGILAALLAGCFNPITAVPPKSGDAVAEQGEAAGAGIPDTGSFVVTIAVNPVSNGGAAGRAAADAGLNIPEKIKNTGVINTYLLVVLDTDGEVVDFHEGNRTDKDEELAQVSLNLPPGSYDFLLLLGHRERNYAQEGSGGGPYLYKAGAPTLLAAGFLDNKVITGGGSEKITITMWTLAVEAKFTSETTTPSSVTADAKVVTLGAADDWKLTWTVKASGLKALKDAREQWDPDQDKSGLFRAVSGAAWRTGGSYGAFSSGPRLDYAADGRGEITLNLAAAPKSEECAAWFNLEYAPFSLGSGKWDGQVWVIRNGINDLPQDGNTNFGTDNSGKIQWGDTGVGGGTTNGNGAVRFTLPASTIADLDLTLKVPAPVTGGTPAAVVVGVGYIGKVEWKETGKNDAHSGLFQPKTFYTATAALYPLQGYTFEGVAANSFTHTGSVSSGPANEVNSGIVTIVFPATVALPTVTDLDLTLKVPAPVKGATPVTDFAAPQYTRKVDWSKTTASTTHTGDFASGTKYTAVVTLTAAPGYSFEGVGENSFRHDGKDPTVTPPNPANAVNSGVVTIGFPVTAVDVPGGWNWGQE